MDTTSGTVTIWQSGRLAPRAATRRVEFTREQWLAGALLVLSALVLTAFVAVLQNDVATGPLRAAQAAAPSRVQPPVFDTRVVAER